MTPFRVGIIGCGRPWKSAGATGFGMAHAHALGYTASQDSQIVALADVNLENAHSFQIEHGGDRLYADYMEMLAHEGLDIVSICTWLHLHAPMVIAAANAGVKPFIVRSRWHQLMAKHAIWWLSVMNMVSN